RAPPGIGRGNVAGDYGRPDRIPGRAGGWAIAEQNVVRRERERSAQRRGGSSDVVGGCAAGLLSAGTLGHAGGSVGGATRELTRYGLSSCRLSGCLRYDRGV